MKNGFTTKNFKEMLDKIDKQKYESPTERRCYLELIKASFRENEHLKEYVNTLEKEWEILNILKPYLKETMQLTNKNGWFELRFKPIAFGFGKILKLDNNFYETPKIEKLRKVEDWLKKEGSK